MIHEEKGRLGIHESGRGAVGDGHALGLAGGAGGKDDPGGIVRGRRAGLVASCCGALRTQGAEAFVAEHAVDVGLAEDHLGALVGVVGIDRHVGRARSQGGQNRQVKFSLAGGHPDANAVAAAHAVGAQLAGPRLDIGDQLGIGEHLAVVKRGGVGMQLSSSANDVPERAFAWGMLAQQVLLGDVNDSGARLVRV